MLILAACLIAIANRHAAWGVVLVALALLTAPLWPLISLRFTNDAQRPQLVTALNVYLTGLVGLAIGAALLLVFVGIFVICGVVIAEITFSLDSARRTWTGDAITRPRSTIAFVK